MDDKRIWQIKKVPKRDQRIRDQIVCYMVILPQKWRKNNDLIHRDSTLVRAVRRHIYPFKSKPYPQAKNAEIKKNKNRFVKLFINSPGERRVIRSLKN